MIKIRAGAYKQLGKAIVELGRKDARAATSRALKRAATSVTAQGVKSIRERRLVRLPAGDLKRLFSTRMNVKGDIRSMFAVISISSRAISLAKYWAKRVAPPAGKQRTSKIGYGHKLKAVRVNVLGKSYIPGGAFLVDGKNGGVIMKRVGRARLPLAKLYGPSVADLVIYSGIQGELETLGMERLEQTLIQELNYRRDKIKSIRS